MPDLGAAVVGLGNPEARHDAVQLLLDAGASAIPVLREGLTHPYWRVRHMSCRLLDDLPLDADLLGELWSLASTDPNKRVRRQAWHAVTCAPCKPDGLDLSFEVALSAISAQLRDRSLRVRRGGATGLLFAAVAANPDVDRTHELIELVLRTETDETIVTRARRARSVLEHRAHRAS